MRSSTTPELEVSVVIPFADDEERVGALSRRIAGHLRALGLRFEILAVDEDSGDNSVALLSLLRAEVPELRVLEAPGHGHGFAAGARAARGSVLWLVDARRGASSGLAPFSWAHARVSGDAADVVAVEGRYVLCRRTRAWRVLDAVRGRGDAFERRFLRRARTRGLRVETPPRPSASRDAGAGRRMGLGRVLDTITSARFVGFLRSRA